MGLLTILVISQVDNAHVLIMFLGLNVMFVQLGGMVSQIVKVRQTINSWGTIFIIYKITSECKCYTHGSVGIDCTDDGGVCTCNAGYTGTKCNQCETGWFMVNGKCYGKFPVFMYLYLPIK